MMVWYKAQAKTPLTKLMSDVKIGNLVNIRESGKNIHINFTCSNTVIETKDRDKYLGKNEMECRKEVSESLEMKLKQKYK